MSRALIIVDLQYDFLPGGNLAVAEGDAIIPVVVDLITGGRYDLIVATQDWHPSDHGSFASAHEGAQPFDLGELNGLEQIFWPDHCVQGEHGARLHEAVLETLVGVTEGGARTLIIKKGQQRGVDSYSAFFDNARKNDTGLHKALQSYEIDEIDVVGLAFDYCVKFTALDSASLGYKTRVLLNGTRPVDAAAANATIGELEAAGVRCSR